jgi:hypothetical protein
MEMLKPFGYRQGSESQKKKGNEVGFRIAHAMRFRYLFPTTSLAKQLSSKPIISITFFLPELKCLFLKLAQFRSLHKKKIYSMLFGVQRIYHQVSQGKREKSISKNLVVILCPIPQFFSDVCFILA